ncbi:MAG: helix-turn-helix transcriptional regulator [Clostridia bacterium]|nr:helix-turn-helix transcriptional regulator [Clostridia bacterium]
MDNLMKHAEDYIKYLKDEHSLLLSLHFDRSFYGRLSSALIRFIQPLNFHTNAYCLKIKGLKQPLCLKNQENILKSCKKDESILSTCHAGVTEFIYPLFFKDTAVGYICVSGYMAKDCNAEGSLWKSALKSKIPEDKLNILIPPLAHMLTTLISEDKTESDNEFDRIINFLSEYHKDISLSALAARFSRSKSHISHLFKTNCGMTLRAYLNSLKLRDALILLRETDLPVTEIALDSGFNDTSYFIYLFKKEFGTSPLKYRKKEL